MSGRKRDLALQMDEMSFFRGPKEDLETDLREVADEQYAFMSLDGMSAGQLLRLYRDLDTKIDQAAEKAAQ